MDITIKIPSKVEWILSELNKNGFEGYIVGGCVRDALLHREPEDWDITTSAAPEQIKGIFRRTIDTGIEHGTVTVMMDKEGYEVTTYRIDGEYEDSRHPKEVTFTSSLKEDLSRRDFTINAMAYHPEYGLVDEFCGMEDLKEGIIRCVGDARERFCEDALRMLRAVRFSAQLDFTIHEDTLEAMKELAPTIEKISAERIHVELRKLLVSEHPDRMYTAYETHITSVILPEFDRMLKTRQENPHHQYNVGEHSIRAVENIHSDKNWKHLDDKTKEVLSFAMLLHDCGKPECRTTDAEGVDHFKRHPLVGVELARRICNRLKFDNESKDKILRLIEFHDYYPAETMAGVRRAANRIGPELMDLYFMVRRADLLAQSMYLREEKCSRLKKAEELYREILEKKQCLSIRELTVNGNDLINIGVLKGPAVGKILQQLLEIVLEDSEKNKKEILIELAKEMKEKFSE